ncbi:MAG: ThuA domain-containing protein [Phycisphaerae bacterium]|jgi:type 1 glutamine amidotransferase
MAKRALFVWGGWDGHTPRESTDVFAPWLSGQGYNVGVTDQLEVLADAEKLRTLDLIVPVWTCGDLTGEQEQALCAAVAAGTGLAGWHGTAGDAFRRNTEYQFMTGGQFVAHPGGIQPSYTINLVDREHPITRDLDDFDIPDSEQYYMHVDPANHVLATTTFPDGTVMPAVWTRRYGQGRVAYASFGHTWHDFNVPAAREIVRRSLLWASR